jgi:membrane protein
MDRHEVFVMAAALAYATAFALGRFILIILSLLSVLNLDLQKRFATELTASFGGEVGTAVGAILEHVDQHPKLSGVSGLIGVFVLFFSASIIISQLRVALDKINEQKPALGSSTFWGFLRSKFWAIGLILGFAFLSIASLLITALINMLYSGRENIFWLGISWFGNFFIFSGLFALIYRFVPTTGQTWKNCFYSGMVSTIFFLSGKGIISLYLGKASLGSPYGAAGSLIVFLAWVYFTALTLLMSYEISVDWFRDRFRSLS